MTRIEPIRRTHRLVARDPRRRLEDQPLGWDGAERRRRRLRPPVQSRIGLGEAAEAAAYEVHRLTSGFSAGLRADLGVRGIWAATYASAALDARPTRRATLRKIT